MSIPKFDAFIHPCMICLNEKKECSLRELCEYCANIFHLTPEDLAETVKSGQSRLYNRVNWSTKYLRKAGLIESSKRGIYAITGEGSKVISAGNIVNIDFLKRYSSFVEYYSPSNKSEDSISNENRNFEKSESQTPQEMIEDAVKGNNTPTNLKQLHASLSDDLLNEISKISPWDFEHLVVKLLIKMGYGDLQQNQDAVTKKSGDEGIDGVVTSDEFGFDSVYIQAKKWKKDSFVGRPEIMKFMGALAGQGATKGLFITTTKFSGEAIEYANKQLQHKIVLVDGQKLTELMIKFNLVVSVDDVIEIKKIDTDFFGNEQ